MRAVPSLSFRLSVVIGLLLVAGLWAAVLVEIEHDRREVRRATEVAAGNLARAFEVHVHGVVHMADTALRHLRDEHDLEGSPDLTDYAQHHALEDAVLQVSVVGADGRLRSSSLDAKSPPIDLSDREHIKVHLDTPGDFLHISKPVLGRVSGRSSIQFTRKLLGEGGEFHGVIVLSLDTDYLVELFESVDVGHNGAITLVGMDRVIRARASRVQSKVTPPGATVPDRPFFDPAQPDVGYYEAPSYIDGVERIGAWRRLPEHALVVVVLLAKDEAFAAFHERRWQLLAGSGALSLTIMAFSGAVGLLLRRQRRTADKVAQAEERWRLAFEAVGDGVWDWDARTGEVYFSAGWKAMLGYAPDEIAGRFEEWRERLHPADAERMLVAIDDYVLGRSPHYSQEHRLRGKDGRYRWILTRGVVVARTADGRPARIIGTHTDIDDRKRLEGELIAANARLAASEERLRTLATTDALTGVPNRRSLYDRAQTELPRARRYGRPLSAVIMDIDHFKRVNDAHGHAAGDAVLREVAQRFARSVRRHDILGRLGGEEFAAVLPETDLARAMLVAEYLRETIAAQPIRLPDGGEIIVTASFGVAQLGEGDDGPDALFDRADRGLYRAKAEGRNRVVGEDAPAAEVR